MAEEAVTLEKVSAEIQTISADLGKSIEKRDAEIKANGQATEETGKLVDTLGEKIEQLVADAKGVIDTGDAMKKRIDEMEKKFGRPGMPNFANPNAIKTPGRQFAESEAYNAMIAAGKGTSDSVKVKSFFPTKDDYGVVTLDGDADASALVVPYRVPEVIMPPMRQMRIRDLMTVSPTSSGAIEYTEEIGFAPFYSELAVDAVTGDKTFTLEAVGGLFAGQTIFVELEEFTIASVDADNEQITVAGSYGLTKDYNKGSEITSSVFGPTTEARRKPQMNIQYELKTIATKTVAAWIPVSKQALSDAGQLRTMIDTRLLYALGLSEDYQLLYGTGVGQQMQGIMTHASAQSYKWSDGEVGDTRIDAVRRSFTKARLAEYPIDGVVLHPTDWEYIELAKGSNERYIWVQVNTGGVMQLWKAPVIDSTAIAAGEFLTGAFKLGGTIYDQEAAAIDVAEQHADFFIKNMVAIRAEERIAPAWFRPEAFVVGDFDSAPV